MGLFPQLDISLDSAFWQALQIVTKAQLEEVQRLNDCLPIDHGVGTCSGASGGGTPVIVLHCDQVQRLLLATLNAR